MLGTFTSLPRPSSVPALGPFQAWAGGVRLASLPGLGLTSLFSEPSRNLSQSSIVAPTCSVLGSGSWLEVPCS